MYYPIVFLKLNFDLLYFVFLGFMISRLVFDGHFECYVGFFLTMGTHFPFSSNFRLGILMFGYYYLEAVRLSLIFMLVFDSYHF